MVQNHQNPFSDFFENLRYFSGFCFIILVEYFVNFTLHKCYWIRINYFFNLTKFGSTNCILLLKLSEDRLDFA